MADPLFVQEQKQEKCFEIKRYGYSMVFTVSADGVECCCSYEPATTGGAPLTNIELESFLTQFRIVEGILPEGLADLLHAAKTGKAVTELLIARGTSMIPGEDGELVFAVSDAMALTTDEGEGTETIDLRKVQSFLNVDEGQHVATILPPGPGTPGITVHGKEIPPTPGACFQLVPGLNVRLGDDGMTAFAETAGRVCQRGFELSVEDVYVVKGDVDFKVGNIVFKGFVEIKGDVLDGFSVKSTGGIKVHGIIGVCTIESDGDISFSGMNGRGTGSITCGGSITANYIYDTSVECAGDVMVDLEIRNAQIRTLGAICVNRRGISGGEYFALAGIESFFLGNVVSQNTRVVSGVHYRDLEELNQLFQALKQLIAEYRNASKETADMKEFTRKRAEIVERTEMVHQRKYVACNPKINVKKVLYEGVNITLGHLSQIIKEAHNGPLSIIENTVDGGFRYLGMTPLSFQARDIEETFIQQQKLAQKKLKSALAGEGT